VASSSQVQELAGLPALAPRASTAEHAARVLRLQIAQGRLLPGTRLREEQVSAAFAISRNTVREAFRLLSHERLVDHTMHRGVRVRTVGREDIRSLYLTRRLVEPLGIDAAVEDAEVRAAMRQVVDEAAAAAARADWRVLGTADIEFHRALMSACRSPHLSAMFEHLLAELRLAFLLLPDHRALHEPYVARNRRLVALLEAGDRDGARTELGDYLEDAEQHLLGVLAHPVA
jgi:DNA-binding GntR family transcriptional regulator